jgi:hypothetical protein
MSVSKTYRIRSTPDTIHLSYYTSIATIMTELPLRYRCLDANAVTSSMPTPIPSFAANPTEAHLQSPRLQPPYCAVMILKTREFPRQSCTRAPLETVEGPIFLNEVGKWARPVAILRFALILGIYWHRLLAIYEYKVAIEHCYMVN